MSSIAPLKILLYSMNNCNCCRKIVTLTMKVLSCNSHSIFQTKFTATSSVEQISTFWRKGLKWLSSNKNTLQIFLNQPQNACYNGWHKLVLWNKHSSLTYGSLQVLMWNNNATIKQINDWNWYRHITDFFQYTHAWSQGGIMISI